MFIQALKSSVRLLIIVTSILLPCACIFGYFSLFMTAEYDCVESHYWQCAILPVVDCVCTYAAYREILCLPKYKALTSFKSVKVLQSSS